MGALGVLLGAFGAHALRPILPLQVMTIYETAVRYHLVHSVALLVTAIAMGVYPGYRRRLAWIAGLYVAGIVLFSGSLYTICLTDQRWMGIVTPVGGVLWVAAWAGWAVVFRRPDGPARGRARSVQKER